MLKYLPDLSSYQRNRWPELVCTLMCSDHSAREAAELSQGGEVYRRVDMCSKPCFPFSSIVLINPFLGDPRSGDVIAVTRGGDTSVLGCLVPDEKIQFPGFWRRQTFQAHPCLGYRIFTKAHSLEL
jgi:hypothetical protein